MKSFINWLKKPSSDRVLLIIALILLNLVSIRGFMHVDLTRSKQYSISKASKDVVKHIDAPLSVKAFFSSNLPEPYNIIPQYVSDLLVEYKANGSKYFSYQVYNMSKQEHQKIASEFGLGPVQINKIETTQTSSQLAWMGIVITYGDYIATLDSIKSTDDIEYKITTTISKIISAQENNSETLFTIGYLTGHEETKLQTNQYAMTTRDAGCQNFYNLLSDIYTIRQINLSNEDVPADLNTIIINNPLTSFSDAEFEKLDSFIARGGSLVVFAGGLEEIPSENMQQPPEYVPNQNGIIEYLSKYGIKIENSMVFDDKCHEQNSMWGKQKFNWAPVISKKNLDQHNEISKNLDGVLVLANSPIDVTEAENKTDCKLTVLAKTSKYSWTQNSNIILHPAYLMPPADKSEMKSENVAVLLEGKLKSDINARIVVVSSGVITSDDIVTQETSTPLALFLRNTVDYANGAADFCTMRTKGKCRDLIQIKSPIYALIIQLLNMFGPAVIVALIGFIASRIRNTRRYLIHQKYNPDDERTISKKDVDKKVKGENEND